MKVIFKTNKENAHCFLCLQTSSKCFTYMPAHLILMIASWRRDCPYLPFTNVETHAVLTSVKLGFQARRVFGFIFFLKEVTVYYSWCEKDWIKIVIFFLQQWSDWFLRIWVRNHVTNFSLSLIYLMAFFFFLPWGSLSALN